MTEPKFTKGPWSVDHYALHVESIGCRKAPARVCDIRGWGYLTGKGHGALGLSQSEAILIQKANAYLIAAAPELYDELARIDPTNPVLAKARGE